MESPPQQFYDRRCEWRRRAAEFLSCERKLWEAMQRGRTAGEHNAVLRAAPDRPDWEAMQRGTSDATSRDEAKPDDETLALDDAAGDANITELSGGLRGVHTEMDVELTVMPPAISSASEADPAEGMGSAATAPTDDRNGTATDGADGPSTRPSFAIALPPVATTLPSASAAVEPPQPARRVATHVAAHAFEPADDDEMGDDNAWQLRLAKGELVALVAVDDDGWADVVVVVNDDTARAPPPNGAVTARRGEVPVTYLTRLKPTDGSEASSAAATLPASPTAPLLTIPPPPQPAPGAAMPIPLPCETPPPPSSQHADMETVDAATPARVPADNDCATAREGAGTVWPEHPADTTPANVTSLAAAEAGGRLPPVDPLGRKLPSTRMRTSTQSQLPAPTQSAMVPPSLAPPAAIAPPSFPPPPSSSATTLAASTTEAAATASLVPAIPITAAITSRPAPSSVAAATSATSLQAAVPPLPPPLPPRPRAGPAAR